MISGELAVAIVVSVVLSVVLSLFTLGEILKKRGPELMQGLFESEKMRHLQARSAETKVNKTANQMIAEYAMEQSPVAPLLQQLPEDIRSYLAEHPEALPGILQNYAGIADMLLKHSPQLIELAKQLMGQQQDAKVDYTY